MANVTHFPYKNGERYEVHPYKFGTRADDADVAKLRPASSRSSDSRTASRVDVLLRACKAKTIWSAAQPGRRARLTRVANRVGAAGHRAAHARLRRPQVLALGRRLCPQSARAERPHPGARRRGQQHRASQGLVRGGQRAGDQAQYAGAHALQHAAGFKSLQHAVGPHHAFFLNSAACALATDCAQGGKTLDTDGATRVSAHVGRCRRAR